MEPEARARFASVIVVCGTDMLRPEPYMAEMLLAPSLLTEAYQAPPAPQI